MKLQVSIVFMAFTMNANVAIPLNCGKSSPMSALVEEKILCMHGGLSPELNALQAIADLQRPCDVPDVGLMCDLIWSDPDPNVSVSTVRCMVYCCDVCLL